MLLITYDESFVLLNKQSPFIVKAIALGEVISNVAFKPLMNICSAFALKSFGVFFDEIK